MFSLLRVVVPAVCGAFVAAPAWATMPANVCPVPLYASLSLDAPLASVEIPKNAPGIPLALSQDRSLAAGVRATLVADEGISTAADIFVAETLAVSALHPALARIPEGTFESSLSLRVRGSGVSGDVPCGGSPFDLAVRITEASTLPTTFGEARVVELPADLPTAPDVPPPSTADAVRAPKRFSVLVPSTDDLEKARYLVHANVVARGANDSDGPRVETVLANAERDTASAAFAIPVEWTCSAVGPVRVRMEGGVIGGRPFEPVERVAGTCTAEDVGVASTTALGLGVGAGTPTAQGDASAAEGGCSVARGEGHARSGGMGALMIAAAALLVRKRTRRA